MKLPLILSASLLLVAAIAVLPAPAAAQGACVGSYCPPGTLACVDPGHPALGFCVVDPILICPPYQILEEEVGPVRVTAGGCGVRVWVFGHPILP